MSGDDSILAHQTGHPIPAASVAAFLQLRMDSGTAIGLATLTVNRFDLKQQASILLAPWAFGTFQSGIEPTTTHFQSPTHQTDCKCSPVSPYEIVFHCGSSENMATAFFNMSRSMRRRLFSRLN